MLRRGRCGLARPPRRRRVDGSLIRNSESASRVTSRDSRRRRRSSQKATGTPAQATSSQMSLVPKLVQVTVPEGVGPGDTINVEAEGQTVQCQVPEGLKPGDTSRAALIQKHRVGPNVRVVYS